MNYARIYAAFISDRMGKQPKENVYFERHHIQPRALGGSDDAKNIIRLTPEDHFFSHLLLAKIHGGRMWAPVALMVGGSRKDYRPTHSRIAHGWAKRALGLSNSGDKAHQFDKQIYCMTHADGRSWSGLQSQIAFDLGLEKSLANRLIKGRIKSSKGWSLSGVDARRPSGDKHPMYRSDIHHFRHADGRQFIGTQYEFNLHTGMNKTGTNRLVNGKAITWNGWHLNGAVLPKLGRASKWVKCQPEPGETLTGFKPT